jgi:hypothetical protein
VATYHTITGLREATDVTMKRGVIGSLQSEDHTAIVQTWVLERARITKHVSGPFNAKGTAVAMEELTITYERLEMPDQD